MGLQSFVIRSLILEIIDANWDFKLRIKSLFSPFAPKMWKLGFEYEYDAKFAPDIRQICPKLATLHLDIPLKIICANKVPDIRIKLLALKCTNV